MAYIRHFSGLITILLLITLRANSSQKVNPGFQSTFRETSEGVQYSKILNKGKSLIERYNSRKLATLGIKLHPGTIHREDSRSTPETRLRCRSLVYQTLIKLPSEHRSALKELTLFYTEDGRRGLGGNGSIFLRCLNVTDEELVSVFVHEMGHIVDSGFLTGRSIAPSGFNDFEVPLPADDPSVAFFRTTWNSENEVKPGVTDLDFVSLYAMSDPFEDFAETYTYYRLHGPEFRLLAKSSAPLRKKYEFMRDSVFFGKEFGEQVRDIHIDSNERVYDITVLPFPLRSFLG